jgi:secondary thiamine-phosphate synthase enzyme
MLQQTLQFSSPGRGFTDITREVQAVVDNAGVATGLCNVFVRHTSASLIINENADPAVRADFERYFTDLVQDGDPRFTHRDEGDDDMSGHIRSILTQPMVTIPVGAGQLLLGRWQAIYLWEHRTHALTREVVVTVQ